MGGVAGFSPAIQILVLIDSPGASPRYGLQAMRGIEYLGGGAGARKPSYDGTSRDQFSDQQLFFFLFAIEKIYRLKQRKLPNDSE